MATMSLAAHSLFPYDAGGVHVPASASSDPGSGGCTPRHLDTMHRTEAVYSLAGLSLFPSVPVGKAGRVGAVVLERPSPASGSISQSSTLPTAPRSAQSTVVQTTTTSSRAQPTQPARPTGNHHKNKSAPTTRLACTTPPKHLITTSAITTSTVPKPAPAATTPRRTPNQPLSPKIKPLVLNATPALTPLPQYSPYDTARKTSGVETCVRRARSSTVSGVSELDGHASTSFAARVARKNSDGWPLPATYVVEASKRLPLVVMSVSLSNNEPESPLRSSPPTPPPSKPLPAVPKQSPSSYLAFPYIEHKRPGGIRKHKSVGIMRSTQSTAEQPELAKAPVTPSRPLPTTKESLMRSKSFDRTRPRTLLPPLEMVDSPSSTLLPRLITDDWSPASSRLSSYPPTPQHALAKVDFGPSTTLDKLNFDWELASSIHTAGTTRDSIDYFLHPLPGASAASLEPGERARRRRSRSATRPSRLGASAGSSAPMPTAAASTKELPGLLTATEMFAELDTLPSRPTSVEEAGALVEHENAGRHRSQSSPIWKKVKAGWHLPKLLRPKSWEKVGG